MKVFHCQRCSHLLFFENTVCERCGAKLGYLPDQNVLSALRPVENGWSAATDAEDSARTWRYCANATFEVCNWLVDAASDHALCRACDLNRYIPNLNSDEQREAWQRLEFSKHRLVYSLLRFNLPLVSKKQDPQQGLSFDFISEADQVPNEAQTMTGHVHGQVTISVAETDPVERERMRELMNEPYRTLIGHFRHEVGHYYWEQLIAPFEDILFEFRHRFGDERQDYQEALQRHYAEGAPADWTAHYISAYASTHPWEDWAETWAHYFHMIDTLETAYAFGLSLQPPAVPSQALTLQADIDPYVHPDFVEIANRYLPLTYAVNSLNRSMGQPDLYPFVLTDTVKNKLEFIHRLILMGR